MLNYQRVDKYTEQAGLKSELAGNGRFLSLLIRWWRSCVPPRRQPQVPTETEESLLAEVLSLSNKSRDEAEW